jgi:putative transposase
MSRFNQKIHHRRSIRLRHYDYTAAGAYFITVCAYNRQCLFGELISEQTILSRAGEIVDEVWKKLPLHYPRVILDELVVMPNHCHGIVFFSAQQAEPESVFIKAHHLGEIVRAWKNLSTKQIHVEGLLVDLPIWQRNYYEHIIRDENELGRVRQYIADNPLKWDLDQYHTTVFL